MADSNTLGPLTTSSPDGSVNAWTYNIDESGCTVKITSPPSGVKLPYPIHDAWGVVSIKNPFEGSIHDLVFDRRDAKKQLPSPIPHYTRWRTNSAFLKMRKRTLG